MAKLWQRSRETGKERELVEADLSSISIDQPTVIFLPGIFTTNRNRDSVAEGIEEIEAMLKEAGAAPPQIYGLSHNNLANIFNLVSYNGNPDKAFSRSAQQMAEALILPLVTKNGKPLPEEEAAARLRNLTLVGYSAGTVFGQELFNASLKSMKKAGFQEERARRVLGEIVLISMATVSRPTREKDRFTTLYLAAPDDLAVRLKNRIWRPLSRLFLRFSRDLSIRKLSSRSLLVTSRVGHDLWHWRKKPDGTKHQAPIKPLVPQRLKIRTHHEMPHYLTRDDGHNGFAAIVLNGLVNAIRRTGAVTVESLLEPVCGTKEENEVYKARIGEGFRRGAQNNKDRKRGTDDRKNSGDKGIPAAPAGAAAQPRHRQGGDGARAA